MSILQFQEIQALYAVETTYKVNSNVKSTCSIEILVNGYYDVLDKRYGFIFKRDNMLIDGKPIEKLADQVMMAMGDLLYPLRMYVSKEMEILEIVNEQELRTQWHEGAHALLKKYPSHMLEKYIRFAQKNVATKEALLNTYLENTFFKLYFAPILTPTPEDELILITWKNFPKRMMTTTYVYRIDEMKNKTIKTSGELMKIGGNYEGKYEMNYDIGDAHEILKIEGYMTMHDEKNTYEKHIRIEPTSIYVKSDKTEKIKQ